MKQYLTAKEAALALGIQQPTLYAYVSRGLIRSEATDGKTRAKRYRREDVEALKQRKEMRRDPGKAAELALHFGAPVLESGITLIENWPFLLPRPRCYSTCPRTHFCRSGSAHLDGRVQG